MSKEKGTIYLAYGSNLNLKQMAYRSNSIEMTPPAMLLINIGIVKGEFRAGPFVTRICTDPAAFSGRRFRC